MGRHQVCLIGNSQALFSEEPPPDKTVGKGPWFASANCDFSEQLQLVQAQLQAEKDARRTEIQAERTAREAELRVERTACQLDSLATITSVPFIDNVACIGRQSA